jgi:hypothetical protein
MSVEDAQEQARFQFGELAVGWESVVGSMDDAIAAGQMRARTLEG